MTDTQSRTAYALCVARTSPRNSATSATHAATTDATGVQQLGLKALALLALARNKPRNKSATTTDSRVAQAQFSRGAFVAPVALPKGCNNATDVQAIRNRLVGLADSEGIDLALIHSLPDSDAALCADLSDDTLRAYVRALRDSDLRERGQRPEDETGRALCAKCGPLWLHPAVAAVAPTVEGWARVLGCPWCHVTNRRAIPRPLVTCGTCQHFERDIVNPSGGGMGLCTIARERLASEPLPYPFAKRLCAEWRPSSLHSKELERTP